MSEDLFGFEPKDKEQQEHSNGEDQIAIKPEGNEVGAAASQKAQESINEVGAAASQKAQESINEVGAAASQKAQKSINEVGAAASQKAQESINEVGAAASQKAQKSINEVVAAASQKAQSDPQENLGEPPLPREQPSQVAEQSLYFWQQPAWRQLRSQFKRLPHAILMHAPEGYALDVFADVLCRELLVNADGSAEGKRQEALFSSGNHSEIHIIEPSGNTIGVDAVREGVSWLYLRSIKAEQKRILLVRDAHKMPRGAANALLKCLEEPPGNGLLLLLSTKPFALPRTIISRCRKLCPYHVERKTVLDWLHSKLPQDQYAAADMLILSGYGPLAVLQQLDADGLEVRTKIFRFLTNPEAAQAIPALAKSWQAMGTAKVLLWWRVMLLAAIRECLGAGNSAGLAARMAVKGLPQLVAFHDDVVRSEHLYHDRSGMQETALLERLMLLWTIPGNRAWQSLSAP